jgi:hypothetical protein
MIRIFHVGLKKQPLNCPNGSVHIWGARQDLAVLKVTRMTKSRNIKKITRDQNHKRSKSCKIKITRDQNHARSKSRNIKITQYQNHGISKSREINITRDQNHTRLKSREIKITRDQNHADVKIMQYQNYA